MGESIAVAKEADAKKSYSPTRSSSKSIHRVRDGSEMQLGSLGGVIGNIRSNGGRSSVESIATQLSGMPTGEQAPALLALQQTHGNRYVQRVVSGIQAKLVVGQPGDKYEQEADRVADEVMRMPEPGVQRRVGLEEEEELIRTKALSEQITPLVQCQEWVEDEEEIQTKPLPSQTSEVVSDVETSINSIRGGGQPLPESTQAFFEPRFGQDFSQVRLHTDARAAESAWAVNARAFTVGRDVVFGAGQYAPGTSEGQRLMAHELTHVVQQGAGGASGIQQPEGGADREGHRPAVIQRRPLTAEERAVDLASNRFRDDPRLQAAFDNAPPMRFGERGEAVRNIQHALVDLGFEMPVSTKQGTQEPDGSFGSETFRIVEAFQHMQGITKDGIVGRQTIGEIEGRITGRCAPGTLPPLTAPLGGSISVTTVDRSPQRFEACAGGYGHFHWEVAWLTNARNGYIVQEIESAQESMFCYGTPDSGVAPEASLFWETWRVQQDGKVHPPPGTDTWQVPVHPVHRGTWRLTGKVFFVEQLDPHAGFRTGNMDAPLSGSLYATAVQSRNLGPVLLTRHAAGRWDCCGDRNVHEPLEGSGEPPSGTPTEADVVEVLSDLLSEIPLSGEGLGTPAVTGAGETCPPGYTQCDFIDDKIATDAQYALYYLYRQGDMARHNALSMLGAVKSRLLQGIYKVDMQKPALMARRHGTNWWNLIPKSAGATVFEGSYKADKQKPALSVFEPEQPPMMVFRGRIASDRAAMGVALSGAWEASTVGQMAVIIPPPSLQPCPTYLPPITIYGEKPKPEKKPCLPGMVLDPLGEYCILPGTSDIVCTDAKMAAAFQKQQDFCAGIRIGIDMLCSLGASPCDIGGPVGKFACSLYEKISGKAPPGTKHPACEESLKTFYERCVVSTIVGEKNTMPCYPGSSAEIRQKYRSWPGRVK